ncbi:MAG TPA: hypothetical protein VKX28_26370 [Xanthobacteraceae bacterium]|nr:hypothetical protein [Xanthobacteraceae bacterium]
MNRRGLLLLGLAYTIAWPALADQPCCGPITAAGRRLAAVLDGMNVESLWLAHQHVDWKTGEPDRSADYSGSSKSTHCSAFAAAVGLRLGIYMLRPPEHGQLLLASAQTEWFNSGGGQGAGWRPVASMQAAQELANQGKLVVISYANPNPRRPGHIVIVRPSTKSAAQFAIEGPQVIQAATYNRASSPAATSFHAHPGAWPNEVRVFVHDVP